MLMRETSVIAAPVTTARYDPASAVTRRTAAATSADRTRRGDGPAAVATPALGSAPPARSLARSMTCGAKLEAASPRPVIAANPAIASDVHHDRRVRTRS